MPSRTATPTPPPSAGLRLWPTFLWGVFAVNSLFFIPQCLDRWLVPRFFFLSAVLLAGVVLLWRDLRDRGERRLNVFDLLLLAWYGFNLAAVGWSMSWSEGIFYAQKTLLLFLTYRMVRQAFLLEENAVNRTLRQATLLLTFAVSGILLVQLAMAISEHGLDNEKLYDYASAVFGNKSLASDFLFFLLVFNVLFRAPGTPGPGPKWLFGVSAGLLLLLILFLQTRTVYLAVLAGGALYMAGRLWLEPEFSPVFRKKVLPAVLLAAGLLAGLLLWRGGNSTLAERLNPMNYLESATANERRFVWYKTDLLNAEHFWWGVGSGSWKFWLPSKNIEGAHRLQEQHIVFTRAHNDYLEVRAEMGMVGAVLFCSIFILAILAAVRGMRRAETPAREKHHLLVMTAGLAGYCIIQYFDFPRERIEMQVVLAVLLAGIVFYTRDLWNRLPGLSLPDRARALLLLLAVAGLAFNLVIGWYRIRGEIHNVEVLKAMSKQNYAAVAREAQAAENRYYEYTDVAIPLAWYEGVAYYQSNQTDKAVVSFERAYQLNPWNFQVINNYASALVRNKRYRDAIPLFEKALEINPRYEDGKFNLAYTCFEAGDREKALVWLNRMDTIPDQSKREELPKRNATLQRRTELLKMLRAR